MTEAIYNQVIVEHQFYIRQLPDYLLIMHAGLRFIGTAMFPQTYIATLINLCYRY